MTDPVEARSCAGPAGAIEQPSGPITALPDELLMHVFSFCDPQALRRCAQVCRRWDAISGDEQVWQEQPITIRGRATNIVVPRRGAKAFHRAEEAKIIRTREKLLAKIREFAGGLRLKDLPALFICRFLLLPDQPPLSIHIRSNLSNNIVDHGTIIVNGPAPEPVGAEGLKKFCEWYLDFEGLHDEKFGRPGGNDFELENEELESAWIRHTKVHAVTESHIVMPLCFNLVDEEGRDIEGMIADIVDRKLRWHQLWFYWIYES